MSQTKEEALIAIDVAIEEAEEEIADFADRLARSENPLYEMKWSNNVFEAAANLDVLRRFRKVVEKKGIEEARLHAARYALRHSRDVGGSSNSVINLAEVRVMEATGRFAMPYGSVEPWEALTG